MPKLIIAQHLKILGLHEHLQMATRNLLGSPMLFDILTATKDWLESHPFSVTTSPSTAPAPTNPTKSSETQQTNKTVCRFFAKGSCKFGSKCRNYHPGPSQPDNLEHNVCCDQEELVVHSADVQVENVVGIPTSAAVGKELHSEKNKEEIKKKTSMRTAADVVSRIRWDPDLPSDKFTIGYLDRFVGIIEKPFGAFSWEDLATVAPNVLAVPEHRIQYFKYLDEVVWDKAKQFDDIFGSRGGRLIQDVIQAYSGKASETSHDKMARNIRDQTMSKSDREVRTRKDVQERPTHFICVRVTDRDVVSNVQKIQEHILKNSPELTDACLPLTALHVTICMVQLKNSSDIDTARKVLENTKKYFTQYVPKCADLVFSGVDHFHDRLLYAKVSPNAALGRLSFLLISRFQDAGLKTPGNHDRFTPHMTLVKMSRPMQHSLNTNVIRRDSYSGFSETYIGKQLTDGIYLCSMTEPKQDDGFYVRLHFVSNSLLHLSPTIPSLFSRLAHLLETNGLQSARELEFPVTDTKTFDNSIEAIGKLVKSQLHSSCNHLLKSKVVILRGLPGSGKSFLTKNCSEKDMFICSADEYFTNESGVYKFDRNLLPEAHAHCCQHFIKAISDGQELIVVDNTNSMKWEYKIYVYLSQVLGLQHHILEIPHPNMNIASAFCSRNLHNVDMTSIKNYIDRWEEEESAILVPPNIAYPKAHCNLTDTNPLSSSSRPSPLNICLADSGVLPSRLATSSAPLEPFFTGVFLTARAQWDLVSVVSPTHSRVYAEHVTLAFKPSIESLESLEIGKKVAITVWGLGDDGEVQAVTVDLPDRVNSLNKNPHITISTVPSSAPQFSNDMLSARPAMQLPNHLVLEGVIGVAVKESPSEKSDANESDTVGYYPILSKQYFTEKVAPRLCLTPCSGISPSEISICTGPQTVTELFVYDFDGTLFDSPLRVAGMQDYKIATGHEWPYKGWWNTAESLLPPLKVKPGPALASFHANCGRSGTCTVMMTARIKSTEVGVEYVLNQYNVHPDMLILKPDDMESCNTEFKIEYLQKLLDRFPEARLVKLWDDNADNLKKMEHFAKNYTKGVEFDIIDATKMDKSPQAEAPSSALKSFLDSCGLLATPEHCSAALIGVRFIAEQFGKVTCFNGDPSALAHVFGSHCFGRNSDVDLCLLAPPRFTPFDCMERLNDQLMRCGIDFVHKGYSSRCPRLKVKLGFRGTPSIEFDVVFAILDSEDAFNSCEELSVAPGMDQLLKKDDQASMTALSGLIFLQRVQDIVRGTVSCESFGAVVEIVVRILKAHRLKGNCYRCIRTFHIIQLLADFIKTHKKQLSEGGRGEISCEVLFKEFVLHSALLTTSKWEKLCAAFVAPEYIPRLMDTFKNVSKILQSSEGDSTALCYQEAMKRPPFPPHGYVPVRILCSAKDRRIQWELEAVLEARLPTYISQLFSCGLDIVPDGNEICAGACFAVRKTNSYAATLQEVFRKFWNEFSMYHKQTDVHMEMKFDDSLDLEQNMDVDGVKDSTVRKVVEFASSDLSDLHLSASLTSTERRLAHETAERLRISHRTEGEGNERHIHLFK